MNYFLFVATQRNMNILHENTPTLINVDLETFRAEMPVTTKELEGQYFDSEFLKFERYSALELPGILGNDNSMSKAVAEIKRQGVVFKTIFFDIRDARYAWDFHRRYDRFVHPGKESTETQDHTSAFNRFPKSIFVNHWH